MTLIKTLDELDELDGKRDQGKWRLKGHSIYCDRELICNMSDLWPIKGNRHFITALANNWPKISKAMRMAMDELSAVKELCEWHHDKNPPDLETHHCFKVELPSAVMNKMEEINALFEEGK